MGEGASPASAAPLGNRHPTEGKVLVARPHSRIAARAMRQMSSGKTTIIASVTPPLLCNLAAWACMPRSNASRTSSRSHHMCDTMAADQQRSVEKEGAGQGHASITSRGTLNTTAAISLSSSAQSLCRELRLQNACERSCCDMVMAFAFQKSVVVEWRILATPAPIRRCVSHTSQNFPNHEKSEMQQ